MSKTWAEIEEIGMQREVDIKAKKEAENNQVLPFSKLNTRFRERQQAEHERKQAILKRYDVEGALKALAEVKWPGGQVVSVNERRGGEWPVEGWLLYSEVENVPVLKGSGKSLNLGLATQRVGIEIVVTEPNGIIASLVKINPSGMFKLRDGDKEASMEPLSDLVKTHGLERGLRAGIADKHLSDRAFGWQVSTESYPDFAMALGKHMKTRHTMGSMPDNIKDWSEWVIGQFPGFEEGLDSKQLRSWGHDQRGNGRFTRIIDRVKTSGFRL